MTYELGQGTGPLRGVKVVEIAGIGPGPHACMILADLGADVIRIDRPEGGFLNAGALDVLNRGRPSVALDLKNPAAAQVVLDLVEDADILIEGMRPGVAERLGIGPEQCTTRNPALVYGRMTGWGQHGPWSQAAGHDMNYIAITGALHGFGQDRARPHFPNNLIGDFGGGSTYLVIGVLAALLEARVSGRGQVIDAAIVDGTAHLSVGALEPQFYDELVRLLDLDLPDRNELANLGAIREAMTARFKQRTLAEWTEIFAGTDACVAPILTLGEAQQHPHLVERDTFVAVDDRAQPAPAPRFSRTPPTLGLSPAATPGAHTRLALEAWGVEGVEALLDQGVVVQD